MYEDNLNVDVEKSKGSSVAVKEGLNSFKSLPGCFSILNPFRLAEKSYQTSFTFTPVIGTYFNGLHFHPHQLFVKSCFSIKKFSRLVNIA